MENHKKDILKAQDKNSYNRDTEYWNRYYETVAKVGSFPPSPFAKEVLPYILSKGGGKLLEFGCGNGRDSIYFMENGLQVTAIDASETAIDSLKSQKLNIRFLCDDFVSSKEIYQTEYDYCYSRFTLHAINEMQEDALLQNVHSALKENGLFFIEARTIHDEIYGRGDCVGKDSYIYEGHYRRFINPEDFEAKVNQIGFNVVYKKEDVGFSKTEKSDPTLLRIILKKK